MNCVEVAITPYTLLLCRTQPGVGGYGVTQFLGPALATHMHGLNNLGD